MRNMLLLIALLGLNSFVLVTLAQANVLWEVMHHTSKVITCLTAYQEETDDDAHFFLYTRRNRMISEELIFPSFPHNRTTSGDNPSTGPDGLRARREYRSFTPLHPLSPVKSKYFDLRAPTKVLVHGYDQTAEDGRITAIKRAYLARGEYNVIVVDWRYLAASPCYASAARHTRWVGERTADLLASLRTGGALLDTFQVVGFSLGAHVAGFAGSALAPLRVARVTGLDPALPLFLFSDRANRLDRSAARFVDVVHTSGGSLGFSSPLGHADFYPNGGHHQPGCPSVDVYCSHSRAVELYLESVRSRVGFHAVACPSYRDFMVGRCNNDEHHVTFLGDPCSPSANGSYYLNTNDRSPFALI